MAKKKEERVSEEELEMETKAKTKKNSYESKKIMFKVVGAFMAIIMVVGSLFAIFGLLAYLK